MTEVKSGRYQIVLEVSDEELMKIDQLADVYGKGRIKTVKYAIENLAKRPIFDDREGLRIWKWEW